MKTQQPTDNQFKQALAKMLPEHVYWYKSISSIESDRDYLLYLDTDGKNLVCSNKKVLDTELLHLCWLSEEGLTPNEWVSFVNNLTNYRLSMFAQKKDWTHATWQQRVIALAKTKGIEIV